MPMQFILDTCVLSESSKPTPDPHVSAFFRGPEDKLLPAAALIELQVGITKVCATNISKAVALSRWYQQLVSGHIPIIPTGKEVCEVLGTIAADPRLRGLVVAERPTRRTSCLQDLHIAAAALVHRAAIATFNVKDFMLINSCYPLPGIYNPASGVWHTRMASLFDTPEETLKQAETVPSEEYHWSSISTTA